MSLHGDLLEQAKRLALDFVDRTEQAFKDWRTVEGTPVGDAFLSALLLRSKLDRR